MSEGRLAIFAVMPPPELVRRKLLRLAAEVREQLRESESVRHPGESGRGREILISRFLRQLVPQAFLIDTGFVIDSRGGISNQLDIVIYRCDYHPMFEVGGVKHFIAESVAAVIQYKAAIDSRADLQDALDNLRSVKSLDRTGDGENYRIDVRLAPVDPKEFDVQIWTGILAEKSLSRETFLQVMSDYIQSEPRHLWPNCYAGLDSFAALYLVPDGGQLVVRADTMQARQLILTVPELGEPPLLDFAAELLNFLRISALIDFKTARYLSQGGVHRETLDLPISNPDT